MSWVNWVCLSMVLLGAILFLYGANFYESTVGWSGVFLLITGVLAFLIRYIYIELTKK